MRDRGQCYGFIGLTWAVAASLGPVMGGALTEKVSWRWCFYINCGLTSGSRAPQYVISGADELLSPYYRYRLHRYLLPSQA